MPSTAPAGLGPRATRRCPGTHGRARNSSRPHPRRAAGRERICWPSSCCSRSPPGGSCGIIVLRPWIGSPGAVEKRRSGDLDALQRVAPNDELGELAPYARRSFRAHRCARPADGRSARRSGSGEPRQERIPRGDEPRDPHADERRDRLQQPADGYAARCRADATSPRTIRGSAESLLVIINDILDFSKVEAGRIELEDVAYDLDQAVEEVLDLLTARAAEKNIELALEVADNVPRGLIGDVGRVRQVLLNLVGNGVKFTDHGLRARRRAPRRAAVDRRTPNAQHLLFSISDTGIGVPADRQHVLFKRFSQADSSTTRRYGGTGLGLAICKSLVELMGGEIGMRGREGGGSTFWFRLPLRVAPSATLDAAAVVRDAGPRARRRRSGDQSSRALAAAHELAHRARLRQRRGDAVTALHSRSCRGQSVSTRAHRSHDAGGRRPDAGPPDRLGPRAAAHSDGHALLRRPAEREALPRSGFLRGHGQAGGACAAAPERAAGGDECGAAHDRRRRCAGAERRACSVHACRAVPGDHEGYAASRAARRRQRSQCQACGAPARAPGLPRRRRRATVTKR